MFKRTNGREAYLVILIAVQAACAAFFVYDVIKDILEGHSASVFYLFMETLATLSLISAAALEARMLRRLLIDRSETARSMKIARGEMQNVIDSYFRDWALTPAEADVAALTIKGCSITEIAEMRGSRDGTVKTQLNAIYRKAGVTGRTQLATMLIDDLMGTPLVPNTGNEA
ncbi:helix-turn-helix transcriptional regulator [Pseudogemmobacter sp. W21_MBD1_M6]|uniref:helix-turn-helix transcriptional regulator n=1 Tax=Pseudogemmobacter sp. W21_MBD1_M6 TaxID=3240271 RepID=UPI003F973C35